MSFEQENPMLKPAILALIRQVLTVAGTALVNPAEKLRCAETLFPKPFAKGDQTLEIKI